MSIVHSALTRGVTAVAVAVTVEIRRGCVGFSTVGLGNPGALEARARVKSALENSGFSWPAGQIVITCEPAPERGIATTGLDLAVALGVLATDGQIPPIGNTLVVGELALDGRVRAVRGCVGIGRLAADRGVSVLCDPDGGREVVTGGALAAPCDSLVAAGAWARGAPLPLPLPLAPAKADPFDLADVRGQHDALAALKTAAAYGAGLLLIGPPGCGRTMLARRACGILPPMSAAEGLEVDTIMSASGLLSTHRSGRPFRAPHHSCSDTAIVGGGPHGRPGEVSLAHNGVLFLDELPEFRRSALEALAGALRAGEAGNDRTGPMPAKPAMLVASMNPCPCGYFGHPRQVCVCSPATRLTYLRRVEPYLRLFPVQVEIPAVSAADLRDGPPGESSAAVRARVVAARAGEMLPLLINRNGPVTRMIRDAQAEIDAAQRGEKEEA